MESLDESIGLWMVGRRRQVSYAPYFGELLEQSRLELDASVGCDGRWNSVVLHPTMGERVEDRLGGHIHHWNCYGLAGESVHVREEILVAV